MAAPSVRSMEIRVGALVLTAAALLVAFLLLLGDFHLASRSTLHVDFSSSGDVKPGAPVKITGVSVGKVDAVTLWGGRPDPAHGGRRVDVRVTLKVDTDALALLHDDARFVVTTAGILGERYVEIDPGTPDRPVLADGDVVKGVDPTRMEAMFGEAGDTMADLRAVLRDNREELRETVKRVRSLVQHADEAIVELTPRVKESLGRLDRIADALGRAVGDGEDLRRTVASLRSIGEKVDREVGPLMARVPALADKVERFLGGADGLVADARTLIAASRDDVRAALANVRAITEAVRDPKGSIGALLADRELYDDLIAFMKDVKRHPWKVLWKE